MKYKNRSPEKNLQDLFICWAAVIKHHKLGGLETTEIYFSQSWKLGNLKDSVSGESTLEVHKRSHSLEVSSRGRRGEGALLGLT